MFSQVGIGTQNPQGILHIDGAKDNPTSGVPTATQALNDVIVRSTGAVGIGTTSPTSNLSVNGSLALKYTAVSTASYTITNQDYYLLYNGTANTTFTLPAGTLSTCNCSGRVYEIINASNFSITLNPNGTEQIKNLSSVSIVPGQSLKIVNNGSASGNTWNIINYGSQETLGAVPTQVLSTNVSGTQNVGFMGVVIQFPNESFDSYNAWNGSEFTVPVTGTYQITHQSLNEHTQELNNWFMATNVQVFRAGIWSNIMGDIRSGLNGPDVNNSNIVTISGNFTQGEKIRLISFCQTTTNNIMKFGSLVITKL
jgi:hypothetical protein